MKWISPEIAKQHTLADKWPVMVYNESTRRWVKFRTLAELQDATLPGDTFVSLSTNEAPVNESPEAQETKAPLEAQPGDKYRWYDMNGIKKVEAAILAREGDLVQVAPLRWLYLNPAMGRVEIEHCSGFEHR